MNSLTEFQVRTVYPFKVFFYSCLIFVSSTYTNANGNVIQSRTNHEEQRKPNFVIIFCDDLGYGDIGPFGAQQHETPHLDRMASEGIKFTDFYVSSGVCTPSRSSLMTGSYPRRIDMHQNAYPPGNTQMRAVLFPVAHKGLNPNEKTIAETLKEVGYVTAMIGKWHLGDQPEVLPTRQGFDYYYGIPYSNDMGEKQFPKNPPLPLMRNEKVIEAPANLETITQRYTYESVKFIRENKGNPFFLYLPHTMPHDPIFASEKFRGKSKNGIYGDAVEEIDWSVGRIIQTLDSLGLSENTLVIFTSDNGAANKWGGSNAPLSGFKGSVEEGGMRVPALMRWKGTIPAGSVCSELATTMDILPTLAHLSKAELPKKPIDGQNIIALMLQKENSKSPHQVFYYYQVDQLQALRVGDWKLYLPLEAKQINFNNNLVENAPARLYHLRTDIRELKNLAELFPEKVKELLSYAVQARKELGDRGQEGSGQRKAAIENNPAPLLMN